jgi:hypothetical protein
MQEFAVAHITQREARAQNEIARRTLASAPGESSE